MMIKSKVVMFLLQAFTNTSQHIVDLMSFNDFVHVGKDNKVGHTLKRGAKVYGHFLE